jgi:hypothetical protein
MANAWPSGFSIEMISIARADPEGRMSAERVVVGDAGERTKLVGLGLEVGIGFVGAHAQTSRAAPMPRAIVKPTA